MEELLTQQVPHSVEAEQAVLGSMLIDSRCVGDVVGMLGPEDFYLSQNRDIYETIYSMFNFSETIDPVTVIDKMRERGVFQDKTVEYLSLIHILCQKAAPSDRLCGSVFLKIAEICRIS